MIGQQEREWIWACIIGMWIVFTVATAVDMERIHKLERRVKSLEKK